MNEPLSHWRKIKIGFDPDWGFAPEQIRCANDIDANEIVLTMRDVANHEFGMQLTIPYAAIREAFEIMEKLRCQSSSTSTPTPE
jgi:hypothetical protein